jgi:hypothetical protein
LARLAPCAIQHRNAGGSYSSACRSRSKGEARSIDPAKGSATQIRNRTTQALLDRHHKTGTATCVRTVRARPLKTSAWCKTLGDLIGALDMNSLPEMIPDEEFLLNLETEELAGYVLKFAKQQTQNRMLHLGNFQNSLFGPNIGGIKYGQKRQAEITLAVAEAWSWLEVQGLLVTAEGMNGANGFRVLSRRALKLGDQDDLRSFAKARRLEKASLHPRIAQSVWSAFMRGEFDVAAFQAMKAVEVAVREAGSFTLLIWAQI